MYVTILLKLFFPCVHIDKLLKIILSGVRLPFFFFSDLLHQLFEILTINQKWNNHSFNCDLLDFRISIFILIYEFEHLPASTLLD
jgi:hypothetical protein